MSVFRRIQRWFEDPLRAELEEARRDLAVSEEKRQQAENQWECWRVVAEDRAKQLADTLRLVAEMKRAGFVADTFSGPRPPVEESDDERQIWDAIYQRAPRGSQMATYLYQHAQTMLQAEESIEHVVGTILEGGAIDMDDLEEQGA